MHVQEYVHTAFSMSAWMKAKGSAGEQRTTPLITMGVHAHRL